jgi:hypothetical protein
MSNSGKPSTEAGGSSASNGIYRVPALPNLFNGADPKQRLPSFKSARRTDDALSATRDQLQLPSKAKETTRKFAPKIAPKPKPASAAGAKSKPSTPRQPEKNEKTKRDQKKPDRTDEPDKRNKRQREVIQTSGSVFDANTEFEKRVKPTVVSEGSSRQSRPVAPASDRGKRLQERKEKAAENGKKGPSRDEVERALDEEDVNPLLLPMRKSASSAAPNTTSYDFEVKPAVKAEPGSFNASQSTSEKSKKDSSSVVDVKPVISSRETLPAADEADPLVDPSNAARFWRTMINRDAASTDFFTVQFPDYIPVSEKMMLMRNALYEEEQRQLEAQKLKQDAADGVASSFVEANLGKYLGTCILRIVTRQLFLRKSTF